MEKKDIFGDFLKDLGKGAKGIVNNVAEVGSKTMNNIETNSKLKERRNSIERTFVEMGDKMFKDGYDEKVAIKILGEYQETITKMYEDLDKIMEENRKKEEAAENKDFLDDATLQAKAIMDEINKDLENKKLKREQEKEKEDIENLENVITKSEETKVELERKRKKLDVNLEAITIARDALKDKLDEPDVKSDVDIFKDIEDAYNLKLKESEDISNEINALTLSIDDLELKVNKTKEKIEALKKEQEEIEKIKELEKENEESNKKTDEEAIDIQEEEDR